MTNPYQYGAIDADDLENTTGGRITDYIPSRTDTSENESGRTRKPASYLVILPLIVGSIIVALGVNYRESILPVDKMKGGLFFSEKNAISMDKKQTTDSSIVSVSNEYGDYMAQMFSYPFLDGALLVEPYRETTFTIADPGSVCTYNWALSSVADDSYVTEGTSTDGSFVATAYQVGQYSLSIQETCADSSSSRQLEDKSVWVKYVRRELSTLTDDDREDFLDAFHTLWEVNTVDGRELYGDKYKSLFYFAVIHNDAGANGVCDQFHGSVGFINNHLFLGLYLEQSLQLVNPKVALHYLDYSKYFSSDDWNKHMENQLDGGSWTEIMTAKYFGANDPYTGRIVDGRWADTPQPTLTKEFFQQHGVDPDKTWFPVEEEAWLERSPAHIPSPYGLLRAPWNYNAANYTTRFNNIQRIQDVREVADFNEYVGVNCDMYSSFVKLVKGRSLSFYLDATENSVHGMVHFTTGGNGGEHAAQTIQTLRDQYGFDDQSIIQLAHSYGTYFKEHIKSSRFVYPLTCTDMPWSDYALSSGAAVGEAGGPTCSFVDDMLEKPEKLQELIDDFYSTKGMEPTLFLYGRDVLAKLSFEDQKAVMKLVADFFQFNGDMNESSAAADPLYWVAHGAVERLFQFTVFNGWLTDYEYTTEAVCTGHVALGTKQWLEGYYFNDESIRAEELTNKDLIEILHPQGDKYRELINFVYDTSDYPWCNTSEWYD